MNTHVESLLTARGAKIEDGRIVHFGDTPTNSQPQVVPLVHLALLHVSGEDASTFLQNLLTNDVRKLATDRAAPNGFCTPKGRMLASFLMWREGERYCLALSADIAAAIAKKLSMYILRSKVRVSDETDRRIAFGLSGHDASHVAAAGLTTTESDWRVSSDGSTTLISLPLQRHVLVADLDAAAETMDRLNAAGFTNGATHIWDAGDIAAGLPTITARTQEQFVPQMVNFDLIGGVNFQKGCYPGQEIVARTRYLGKLKKRMYRARIEGAAPKVGDSLTGLDLADQSCGEIVAAACLPGGGHEVLAVVQMSSIAAGPVRLHDANGPALQLLPLPYELGE